ncbi:amidohydrolase [Ferruginibacter sp.]|uniref:amidohydrolase n=1 Tax=Ferruginibacter sp. TaxID=1940288 RepID=UPI0019CDB2D9|nr:amidohydrolase [Ferruginibacter sp.]MBC7625817.1 amidohydrolase [Ferruginibacter sp.]
MKRITLLFIFTLAFACSFAVKKDADLLVYHCTIYTVDAAFTTAEAMVISEGKIIATGKKNDLEKEYNCKEKLDAQGKFIYPGFIDAHAHFVGYGISLQQVVLTGTSSWKEVIEKVKTFATENKEGWLTGRGWDQNDWPVKEFPTNEQLTALFPDRPVLLERVDGHASIANKKALELAGIKAGDAVNGGEIETKNFTTGGVVTQQLTGILIDNAVKLVASKIPAATATQFKKALQAAQKNCFAVGLTTIDDCGLDYEVAEQIEKLQQTGILKMRLYVMLSDAKKNYDWLEKNGIRKTDHLNIRSIKMYGDGALGSRGACLLQPYSDKPDHYGFLLSSPEHFDSVANWVIQKGFQLCTHAIGDSGNRTLLKIYAKYLKGPNDLRWRIEHAQVINPDDFNLFGANNIIPSVQPTHATSDMYWADKRLGKKREKGAYAYKQLLQQNGWIPLGTDFPVEDISTFKTFYAAVVRKDAKGWPAAGFQMENALSREETLRGMTIWAAKANFEENEKGSIEKGKLADFVILDADIMKVVAQKLLNVKVLATFLGGEKVYSTP